MLTDELVMFMALIESRTHEIITKKLKKNYKENCETKHENNYFFMMLAHEELQEN